VARHERLIPRCAAVGASLPQILWNSLSAPLDGAGRAGLYRSLGD
jgi:hypothetical protein